VAYELVSGVFAQQTDGTDFATISLPSTRDPAETTVKDTHIGIQSRDFAIDPTQDLVVFLHELPLGTGNLDLRTISSLKPHPLAPLQVLSWSMLDSILVTPLFVHILDDVVSVFLTRSPRLLLFNWRTGTPLMVCVPLLPSFLFH
jgi:hypothetical protein